MAWSIIMVKRADMFIRKYGEPLAFFFFNEELATMTESNKRAFDQPPTTINQPPIYLVCGPYRVNVTQPSTFETAFCQPS